MEPEKNTAWRWMKWSEFVELENLFIPFKYFFEKGFKDLEKIKKVAEVRPWIKSKFKVLINNNNGIKSRDLR